MKNYGLLGVQRDREMWLFYAKKRYGFVLQECEEIFQDCMLHCWLVYDLLTYQEWRQEYRRMLGKSWYAKKQVWAERNAISLDAPLVGKDGSGDDEFLDIVEARVLSVELQVIVRQAGDVELQDEWDTYERLNKPSEKEMPKERHRFDVSLYWGTKSGKVQNYQNGE